MSVVISSVGCSREVPAYVSPETDITTIAAALRGDQPYVVSILGDSTGNNRDEWVHLVARRIARTYGRPVTVHDWKTEQDEYTSKVVYDGPGAPVTVWNGSGSGKSAQYSLQWYAQMAPQQVDLTIISHSHNHPSDAVNGIEQLVKTAGNNSVRGGAVVIVLQNPRLDDAANSQQQAVNKLRELYDNPARGVVLVDVNTAFRNGDLQALLLPDGAHPNPIGSQLWADTVWKSMQL
ncbi:SGNH/GDSL hydrolase family protein [Mycolicibacterium frederiksbergense]|uniref:SGNH/GDSL hydrolase family protein n=1 Tax=Mycolicibacterium frederiksbergense TaxID=117567 RepID=UPI00265BB738|nr:SGNH/GDSL hydrolase family protein [Mycolicibacterium frederiksbergense]MDO0978180.1 SGNH/GDSL hydrolase family protein [Mycolicibacterium frederiksbergense]